MPAYCHTLMKKILFFICFLLFTTGVFAQRFSQYNSGTLYDSFENPSQRSFIPDSSYQFASNFFIPNININGLLTGDAQGTAKSRAFLKTYNNSLLQIDKGKFSHADADFNYYWFMFKMYTGLRNDEEIGISAQVKGEFKGLIPDEGAALLGDPNSFKKSFYDNIFNGNYYYQLYHQISFSYRRRVSSDFAFGFKVSALMGILYKKVDINESDAIFNKAADAVDVGLRGTFFNSYYPNYNLSSKVFYPSFRNPGASISLGTTYRTNDGFMLQGNIKDLGFIHWSSQSQIFNFNNSEIISHLSSKHKEDSVYNHVNSIIHNNLTTTDFTTPIDGRAEISINRTYWIDYFNNFKYTPTLIASKELFYQGFTAAFVNPVQYHNYILTLTGTYDDLKIFTLGGQFMYKTPNFEFFVGSDKLAQSLVLLSDAASKNQASINQNGAFTGADFYIGVSFKFGWLIEHPMNASEHGF